MAGIFPIIDGALSLATSIVDYLGQKEAHRYIDNVRNLQLAISAEQNQPPALINDAKIERMEEQLKIEFEALKNAIMSGLTANGSK